VAQLHDGLPHRVGAEVRGHRIGEPPRQHSATRPVQDGEEIQEAALLVVVSKAGLTKAELERRAALDREVPFDAEQKMMTIVRRVVASLALQVGILTIPIMEPIFKVAPLPIEDWELMAAMALLPLAIVEAVKWLRR